MRNFGPQSIECPTQAWRRFDFRRVGRYKVDEVLRNGRELFPAFTTPGSTRRALDEAFYGGDQRDQVGRERIGLRAVAVREPVHGALEVLLVRKGQTGPRGDEFMELTR